MDPLLKYLIPAVVVFALLALAGVIYGVASHEEPGLMSSAVEWPRERLPLLVCPEEYGVGDRTSAIERTLRPISATNERLGFEAFSLFVHGIDPASCDVTVLLNAPTGLDWMEPGGDARFVHGPRCEIRTAAVASAEVESLVLQHELGHCLGLAHDSWEGSIMRPTLGETPSGEFAPRITDHDRDLLRRLYR